MTETSPFIQSLSAEEVEALTLTLRRKQGNWVEWGQACQQLQKAGRNPQDIFEETGFEPIQQNQVIVAAQVYEGLRQSNADPEILQHFEQRGSDILYEFRVLTQPERVAAASFAYQHKFDSDEAHDITKALKDFSRLSKPPEAFTHYPGDAVAHQCWLQARQKSDLQERSRLIAKGLKYVHSDTARKELEKLLTDFSLMKQQPAPRLPLYRLESEEDLPRILPLVGKLPLPVEALKAVPIIEEEEPFRIVKFAGEGAWVPLPGWQVLLSAEDPVAILSQGDCLPLPPEQASQEVLVVIDRAQRTWDDQAYFAIDADGQIEIQWFTETPPDILLGRVVLVVRPKRILDESLTRELWLTDE
jgi:Rubisco Assembly chaperone C-terminal domain/Rubisco accumulation factor 1 alpha helical domain/Rubisco accumulation factor 1 helix turn helix domain